MGLLLYLLTGMCWTVAWINILYSRGDISKITEKWRNTVSTEKEYKGLCIFSFGIMGVLTTVFWPFELLVDWIVPWCINLFRRIFGHDTKAGT